MDNVIAGLALDALIVALDGVGLASTRVGNSHGALVQDGRFRSARATVEGMSIQVKRNLLGRIDGDVFRGVVRQLNGLAVLSRVNGSLQARVCFVPICATPATTPYVPSPLLTGAQPSAHRSTETADENVPPETATVLAELSKADSCFVEFCSLFRPPSAMKRLRKAVSKSDGKSSHWGRFPMGRFFASASTYT